MDNFGQIQITKLTQEETENPKSSLSTLKIEFGIEKYSQKENDIPRVHFYRRHSANFTQILSRKGLGYVTHLIL